MKRPKQTETEQSNNFAIALRLEAAAKAQGLRVFGLGWSNTSGYCYLALCSDPSPIFRTHVAAGLSATDEAIEIKRAIRSAKKKLTASISDGSGIETIGRLLN